MKYKDYKRLSKISLKARKKTTRSTVRGISFGLILLMPLLFIVIAFHLDLNEEVNKDASIRVFNIAYANEVSNDSNLIDFIKEEYSEQVYDIEGVENVIKYNQYTFSNGKDMWDGQGNNYKISPFTITLDGKTFTLDYHIKSSTEINRNEVGIKVIDTDIGNDIFIKADKDLTNGKPIMAGNSFSNNSAKEIMVSSNFLTQHNLTINDVINKTITITYELQNTGNATDSKTSNAGSSDSLYEYSGLPVVILKDYKIVGVFDSTIYKSTARLNTQREYYQENSKYETYFWITRDSVYNSVDASYLPEYIKIEKENDGYIYYESKYYYNDTPLNLSKNARNEEKVFIPLGMGATEGTDSNSVSLYKTLIEFESYGAANSAIGTIEALYEAGAGDIEDPYITTSYAPDTFNNYRMFYNAFTYVCIVLAIFGGVVFFATLLNLYNTIHYSVQSRRNYLGMIRAIGMRGLDVIKMYFVEVFQIFKRSYIWTAIFGGGICYGISFVFEMVMNSSVAEAITIDLSLNPIYILVAFLALIVVNTIISIVFSLVACHNVSNKPILEVLVENR